MYACGNCSSGDDTDFSVNRKQAVAVKLCSKVSCVAYLLSVGRIFKGLSQRIHWRYIEFISKRNHRQREAFSISLYLPSLSVLIFIFPALSLSLSFS